VLAFDACTAIRKWKQARLLVRRDFE